MNAMEDTEDTIGFIAEKGGDDKSLMEIVDGMGDVAYEVSISVEYTVQWIWYHYLKHACALFQQCQFQQTVKEVEAVEKLANVLTTKVSKQVDTIQSLNTKITRDVTENIQTVINAMRGELIAFYFVYHV